MGLRPGRLLGLDARLSLCPVPPFFCEIYCAARCVSDATLEIDWLFSPERRRRVVGSGKVPKRLGSMNLEEGCDDRDVLHAYYERFADPKTRDARSKSVG